MSVRDLLRTSLISFFRDLKFLSYRSFTYLVTDTPTYFILFVITVKGVISLISFSACLSFEWRKATDLYELILYPSTLLKKFISCRSSLVEFFFGYIYILSYHAEIVISSLPSFQFLSL